MVFITCTLSSLLLLIGERTTDAWLSPSSLQVQPAVQPSSHHHHRHRHLHHHYNLRNSNRHTTIEQITSTKSSTAQTISTTTTTTTTSLYSTAETGINDSNVVLRPSDDPEAFDSFKIGTARVHRYLRDDSNGDSEYVMWYVNVHL